MDEQLNDAPCGFLALSDEGTIVSINQTLLSLLGYSLEELSKQNINCILSVPAQMFYQLYFFPLVKVEKQVEEMYISLLTKKGEEIPVLLNACRKEKDGVPLTNCVLIPMRKRNEFENKLLLARNEAEQALAAKNKANSDLEMVLKTLETKQEELLELNNQNQKYKTDTEKELELARNIQEISLTEPIQNEHLQMESFYKASSDLSGDMYGFYQIDPHRYGIIILDVMGHGISSALVSMSLHSLFQRLISRGISADIVMKELDRYLHDLFENNDEARHYCTAIYLLIDTKKQEIEYVNSGHPPAFWQGPCGEQVELFSSTPPVGLIEGIQFKTKTFSYTKGGRLLLYTDGVTDPLGSNHLQSILREHPNDSITELKERILQSLHHKEHSYHKNDDQCFIIVDFK
ncbi:SpoIIE family protein phosphatase [Halalkalibacter alkalisediminis]|uniref:SpoIIE family protein phosphatase n=1 Tax=Halalkalibacter alkalisediminis TaxID=935616 RepID=A0ABV6NKA0_9BACI|nr:SpoIIE family protein phosphatase [Halalkalibacter alkalisediminis]